MKKLLATTAIVLLAAAPLSAQTAPAAGVIFSGAADANAIYGSNLIGMTVYSSETEYDEATPVNADAQTDWDNIGEVNDVLISQDGQVEAILVDVGGFLGMGEHTVALDMSQVHVLTDDSGDRFAAVNSSKDELEAAPEFERPDMTAMGTDDATPAADEMAADNMAVTPADTTAAPADGMAAAPATDAVARPGFERQGYASIDYATMTAEDLQGATVYDANDDSIGEVSELVLDADGKITNAIVDVGGFLGMGEHSVALSYDELQIMKEADGDDLRVYVDTTKEDLEQRPEYEG